MLTIHAIANGTPPENAYLLQWRGQEDAVLIDPGIEFNVIADAVRSLGLCPKLILATHGHDDHVEGTEHFRQAFGARFLMHQADVYLLQDSNPRPQPDAWLVGGEDLSCGEIRLKVLSTPGHTPGGLCFWHEASKSLFSGDTLFRGDVGRTTNKGGDHELLLGSIRTRILTLPDDTRCWPGHGPATDVGTERKNNPFLR